MRAGDLNRTIRLLRNTPGSLNAYGEAVENFERVLTLKANVSFGTATEVMDSSQITASNVVTFKTRYSSFVRVTDLIEFDGRRYEITGISEIGRRNGLQISTVWRAGKNS